MAEGGNPSYRQANNATSLNGVEMRTTWLDQILPSANLRLFETGFSGNLQRTARDNFGNPIADPDAEWNYFSGTTQSLSLSWSIAGQSLFQAHRRQSLTNQSRELDRIRALTDLQVRVQRLYMDALEQRDLTRAEQELLEARQIDLDVVERLFSLALRTRIDVLNAELAVEQQVLNQRQQQASLDIAVLALRTTLGTDDLGPIGLADEPLPIFDPVVLDADRLVERALAVNPSLQRSRVAIQTADLERAAQTNLWWPQVQAGVDVFRRTQAAQGEALFDFRPEQGLESSFFVQLSIPIFNGFFRNRAEAERATIELDNQREADRETRLATEESIRGSVLELSNQWESVRLAQRSLEIAEEALRLAREEYRLGTRSFEDLRDSFELEADVRRQVITARHRFVDALLDLESAVGTSVRPASLSEVTPAGGS
jgi:outer membrane protein